MTVVEDLAPAVPRQGWRGTGQRPDLALRSVKRENTDAACVHPCSVLWETNWIVFRLRVVYNKPKRFPKWKNGKKIPGRTTARCDMGDISFIYRSALL